MKKIITVISILLLSMIIFTNYVFATSDSLIDIPAVPEDVETRSPDEIQDEIMPISIDLEEDILEEYVEDDLYLGSEVVNLEQSVNGNVYIYAEKVDISSSVIIGNLFVIAKEVKIDADITGSIYVAAGDVSITGTTEDAYIFANRVNLEENSYISRNARVFSDIVNVKGNIGRDLYSMTNYTIVEEFAGVQGKLYYNGNIDLAENEILEVIKIESPNNLKLETEESIKALDTAGKIIGKIVTTAVISTGIFIILLIVIFSRKYEKTEVTENYFVDVIKGFGVLILIPVLSIILIMTIIGIPLALILIVIYIVFLMISVPVASTKISKIILKEKAESKLLQLCVAIAIYIVVELVLKLIPVLGGIIRFIIVLYGLNLITSLPFKNKSNKNSKNEDQVIVTPLD